VGAICASVTALSDANILGGLSATSHPPDGSLCLQYLMYHKRDVLRDKEAKAHETIEMNVKNVLERPGADPGPEPRPQLPRLIETGAAGVATKALVVLAVIVVGVQRFTISAISGSAPGAARHLLYYVRNLDLAFIIPSLSRRLILSVFP